MLKINCTTHHVPQGFRGAARVDHGHHRLKPDNLTQSMINLITLRYRTAVISVTTVFPALFCAAIFFMLLQSPVLDCNYYMGDTHA